MSLALACVHVEDSVERDFIVKAGIMEPAGAGTDRLHETSTITMDPNRQPGWCFVIDPPNDEPYDVYSVHHLPEAPRTLSGDFAHQSTETTEHRTATRRADGIRPFCFSFHDGDPIGEYRIIVFINDKPSAKIRLQVLAEP